MCDLRVGKVLECDVMPNSEMLYKLKIDIGEDEPRLIGSGINGKISIEEVMKGFVLIFANIRPRKLADITSNGMLMCACAADDSVFELVRPPLGSKVGERIQLSGNPIGG
jgi:methionine--tRNA ligase beta chain